jgi:hypothetical protein
MISNVSGNGFGLVVAASVKVCQHKKPGNKAAKAAKLQL